MHVKDVALLFGCDDSILLDEKDGTQYVTKEQFFESVSIYNKKIWEENRKRMELRKKRHSEKYELNNTMKLLTKQNIKLIPEIEKGFNDILDAYEDLDQNIVIEIAFNFFSFGVIQGKRMEREKRRSKLKIIPMKS